MNNDFVWIGILLIAGYGGVQLGLYRLIQVAVALATFLGVILLSGYYRPISRIFENLVDASLMRPAVLIAIIGIVLCVGVRTSSKITRAFRDVWGMPRIGYSADMALGGAAAIAVALVVIQIFFF